MSKQLTPEELARLREAVGPAALQPEPGEYQRPKRRGRLGAEETGLLTPAEVAQLLRVDPRTVSRWARAGKLQAFKTPGGHRRFRLDDVRRILGDLEAS